MSDDIMLRISRNLTERAERQMKEAEGEHPVNSAFREAIALTLAHVAKAIKDEVEK